MPRKGQRLKHRRPRGRSHPVAAQETRAPIRLGHLPLTAYMNAHFDWMQVSGYSEDTVRGRRIAIRRFITWCEERALRDPKDITKPILERYQRHLFYYRKADGKPMALSSQFGCLGALEDVLQVAREGKPHPLQPGLRTHAAAITETSAAGDFIDPGGRGDLARGGAHHGVGLTRSGDARNAVLDRVAAHGAAGAGAV